MNLRKKSTREEFERALAQCMPEDFRGHAEFYRLTAAVVDLAWQKYVKHDSAFDRPTEPARLVGCADKIRKILGWNPAGTFRELAHEMVEAELAAIDSGH
jgi:GDP-D-mannose dehydratase